jgi:hypothetical protein
MPTRPDVSGSESSPRDRRVVLLIALLVVVILAINVVSALVPGMDGALASLPIVVAVLVAGTMLIQARALLR